ncbi:TPR repeat family protein [Orientia tsutsugamushi str. TA763]|nr:TPR repeat family protein [Orientia tsutsugamushi str. TA763]
MKGFCLYRLGQHQEAIENFDLAIKYDPNNGTLYKLINILKQKLQVLKSNLDFLNDICDKQVL